MRCFSVFVLLLAASTTTLFAQQDSAAGSTADSPYVLHVYQNLVQMVTLVMTPDGKTIPSIPLTRFDISIDEGPKFHPTQMHIEGDDPVTLAILMDTTGSPSGLLKKLPQAYDSLIASLNPDDRLSVFAYDCKLVRSALDLPSNIPAAASAVDRVLSSPGLHDSEKHHACHSIALWDAVVSVVSSLSQFPGRRVLLIVSDGHTRKGTFSFSQTAAFAADQSVAIFGMRDRDVYAADHSVTLVDRTYRYTFPTGDGSDEDLFDNLCQRNGGALSTISSKSLPAAMQHFVTMLRNRYILEFPRPNEDAPGRHDVDVFIKGMNAYIRPAGLSVPAQVKADPNTLPPTPSPATFGKHRVLDSGH
jgi:hypothetical protein